MYRVPDLSVTTTPRSAVSVAYNDDTNECSRCAMSVNARVS